VGALIGDQNVVEDSLQEASVKAWLGLSSLREGGRYA